MASFQPSQMDDAVSGPARAHLLEHARARRAQELRYDAGVAHRVEHGRAPLSVLDDTAKKGAEATHPVAKLLRQPHIGIEGFHHQRHNEAPVVALGGVIQTLPPMIAPLP